MRKVYVIGVNMMRFGKYPNLGIKDMVKKAVEGALTDAGVDKEAIEVACFANSAWCRVSGQDCIRGQVALKPLGIWDIPIINVENACAGGSTAFYSAYTNILSGMYDVALTIGVEKVFNPDKILMFAGFLSGMDVENIPELINTLKEFRTQYPPPSLSKKKKNILKMLKSFPNNLKSLPTLVKDAIILGNLHGWENLKSLARQFSGERSPFMDVYAIGARFHMKKYGSTQKQLAIISSKNHFHSTLNSLAQLQKPFSVEEVLSDKLVSYPLTRPMCAPIGDGASAAVLCSDEFLKKLKDARPVKIRTSILGSGKERELDGVDIGARMAERLYNLSGMEPNDIDVAELHDATAYGELHHTETLKFCKEGEGGILAESGETKLGGKIPINVSGGLESRGHPIAATGLAQIFEIVTQLRNEAGKRQVEGAKIGLAQNGGGFIGVEEAAMGLILLEAVK